MKIRNIWRNTSLPKWFFKDRLYPLLDQYIDSYLLQIHTCNLFSNSRGKVCQGWRSPKYSDNQRNVDLNSVGGHVAQTDAQRTIASLALFRHRAKQSWKALRDGDSITIVRKLLQLSYCLPRTQSAPPKAHFVPLSLIKPPGTIKMTLALPKTVTIW